MILWAYMKLLQKNQMIYWILLKKSEGFGLVTDIYTWVSRPAQNKKAMPIANAKSASSSAYYWQGDIYLSPAAVYCLIFLTIHFEIKFNFRFFTRAYAIWWETGVWISIQGK